MSRLERSKAWTFAEAAMLIDELWDDLAKAGWHLGLTGGVLVHFWSNKDADLIAYPRDSTKSSRAKLYAVLRRHGLLRMRTAKQMHATWRRSGSTDRKHVEVWQTSDLRRVDLFILGDR